MSAGRLTFLYPHLLRAARAGTPAGTGGFSSRLAVARRAKSSFAPRHGKAVEPTWDKAEELRRQQAEERANESQQQQGTEQAPEKRLQDAEAQRKASETDASPEPKTATAKEASSSATEDQTKSTATANPVAQAKETGPETGSPELEQVAKQTTKPKVGGTGTGIGEPGPIANDAPSKAASPMPAGAATATADSTQESVKSDDGSTLSKESKPAGTLDAVLHMPSPENIEHPHMTPPPYVHHFDSYSLVKQLEEGGYTREQAVTSMKAIRKLLAQNLDVAQKSLVSKSDVENETYLFIAACSELSTEIKNNRRLQEEQMRTGRTHLQHEVDNLTQTLNQELATLTDSVRGIFDDRKMAVREEQKAVESAIQQINYKMSILLSSDSKSEIEGVRWVLIRRSVVGLVFLAFVTLSMIRYATYLGQQKKEEAARKRKERERLKRDGGRTDNSSPADAALILSAS